MRPTQDNPRRGAPGRRAVLGAGTGLAVAVLTGCSVNNPLDPGRTPAAEAVADLAPDVAVAVKAVGLLLAVQRDTEAVVTAFPGLRARLRGLLDLHAAHVAALTDAVPDGVQVAATGAPRAAAAGRQAAIVAQLAAETTLRDQLLALAVTAQSGPFARLLGTMAAGISQQLVVVAA
ncbi:MAG: hypothetical protein ACJ72D_24470 [Marmoricola sp.]